jgi:LmbE family N-acetylglucosaminyl deacetylase
VNNDDLVTVVLEPHNDDAVLFSAFNAMRYQARVVTVLRSQVQESRRTGITAAMREDETRWAMLQLGLLHEQWDFPDLDPPWRDVEAALAVLRDSNGTIGQVFAPYPEDGAHDHHNEVGRLAAKVFGPDVVTGYLTYTGGRFRSTWGDRVEPGPGMVQRKLRALACYDSQIEHPSTGHHFLGWQHEYVVPVTPAVEKRER